MLAGVIAGALALEAIAAVPPGYRYIGSRSVSGGRVVLWYWNADIVEPGAGSVAFTAHLYARAPEVGQERPYLAIVRCDNRTYRPAMEAGPFQPIDDGEPIEAVWRAGCAGGVAVAPAERRVRLDGTATTAATPVSPRLTGTATIAVTPASPENGLPAPGAPARVAAATVAAPTLASPPAAASTGAPDATASPTAAPAPAASASPSAPPAPSEATDPRRVDACVRFSDAKNSPAGDAAITNTCRYPIEVSLCYKGGNGGPYDCAAPVKGRLSDSLGPGVTHVLPEYRRAHHRGIAAVACRGTPGSVFPRLEEPGRSGCH